MEVSDTIGLTACLRRRNEASGMPSMAIANAGGGPAIPGAHGRGAIFFADLTLPIGSSLCSFRCLLLPCPDSKKRELTATSGHGDGPIDSFRPTGVFWRTIGEA